MRNRGTTLEAKGVTKRYGDLVALDDVTLRVSAGERGSGKTTLLRSFNRMVEPDVALVPRLRKMPDTLEVIPVFLPPSQV